MLATRKCPPGLVLVDTSPNAGVRLRYSTLAWLLSLVAVALVTYVRPLLDWCPLQAYAVLGLLCAARVMRHTQRPRRSDSAVRMCAGYCTRCRRMAVHRCGQSGPAPELSAAEVGEQKKTDGDTRHANNVYSRAYYVEPRAYLVLVATAAWTAYGALFHEGKHANELETLLMFGGGGGGGVGFFSQYVSRVVHTLRLLVYFLVAIVAVNRRRGSNFTHALLWTTFTLLLAFPPDEAIVQRMRLADAVLRVSLFSALLVASDSLDVAAHYMAWLESVRASRVMKMRVYALSGSGSDSSSGSDASGAEQCQCAESADGILVTYTWLMRTTWVLVVTNCYTMTALALVEFLWITWRLSTFRALSQQLMSDSAGDVENQHEAPPSSLQETPSPMSDAVRSNAPPTLGVMRNRANGKETTTPTPTTPARTQRQLEQDSLLAFLNTPLPVRPVRPKKEVGNHMGARPVNAKQAALRTRT